MQTAIEQAAAQALNAIVYANAEYLAAQWEDQSLKSMKVWLNVKCEMLEHYIDSHSHIDECLVE